VGEVNNLSNTNILENPFFHDFADIHKDLVLQIPRRDLIYQLFQ